LFPGGEGEAGTRSKKKAENGGQMKKDWLKKGASPTAAKRFGSDLENKNKSPYVGGQRLDFSGLFSKV